MKCANSIMSTAPGKSSFKLRPVPVCWHANVKKHALQYSQECSRAGVLKLLVLWSPWRYWP